MDILDALRQSSLAQGLSDDQISRLVLISSIVTASDNEDIVREDDEAKDVFILLEGDVRVTTSEGDPIARLTPGAIVGEVALFDKVKRSATVVSQGTSTLIKISAEKFNELVTEHPEIGVIVLKNIGLTLCNRLRSSNVQLEAVLGVL